MWGAVWQRESIAEVMGQDIVGGFWGGMRREMFRGVGDGMDGRYE